MTTVPGLFALGEANFSDHGANRLGASALMQGLADGYFVIPATITAQIAGRSREAVDTNHPEFARIEESARTRNEQILSVGGGRSAESIHRELGLIMWDKVGMGRNAAGLQQAQKEIAALREEFWSNVRVPGTSDHQNPGLEHAARLADFLELAEFFAADAEHRKESCGGHFRDEYQTEDGEALRRDDEFAYAAAWEFNKVGQPATLHKEELSFEYVKLATRSYK
jgi:succinate dehydrogenase / fumarate reductase flavoprotein subunit